LSIKFSVLYASASLPANTLASMNQERGNNTNHQIHHELKSIILINVNNSFTVVIKINTTVIILKQEKTKYDHVKLKYHTLLVI
jgi:hypothetical protein